MEVTEDTAETPKFSVFISHRHTDKRIADAVADVLKSEWGLANHEVYVSSMPGQGRAGQQLTNFLTAALKQTDLFILIFTEADEDWSYCMWELGVVSGQDTKPSTVVALCCSEDQPRVRVADALINAASLGSLTDFATQFHREPEFLIRDKETRDNETDLLDSFNDLNETAITRRARKLFDRLNGVIPKVKSRWIERLEHLMFTLAPEKAEEVRSLREEAQSIEQEPLNEEEIAKLSDEARQKRDAAIVQYSALREQAKDILLNELTLSDQHISRPALERFGFNEPPASPTLRALYKEWNSEFKNGYGYPAPSDKKAWQDELLRDFSRATEGRVSRAPQHLMPTTSPNNQVYVQPVVVRTRLKGDGSVDYSLYLVKVPDDFRAVMEIINETKEIEETAEVPAEPLEKAIETGDNPKPLEASKDDNES